MKTTERKLAAIVFTDLVGYSAMMQKDEVITTKLRNKHREAFKKFTKSHGGKVIQYFGDGTLSVYPSASAAVEFAVALQKTLKNADPPVPVRIGIHTGDITFGEEDAYGDGVNIASRIETMCIPGGVFISGKVYDDIKNHSKLRAEYLGLFDLKNIQNPMEIFAVSNRGITVPEYEPKMLTAPKQENNPKVVGGRKKKLAGILGILFGGMGIHRFYLGNKLLGFAFLVPFLLGAFSGDPDAANFLLPVAAVGGFVDGLLMFLMPQKKFDEKFNKEFLEKEDSNSSNQKDGAVILNQSEFLQDQLDLYLDRGLADFQDNYFKEAIFNLI